MKTKKIAVVMGGLSSEREVSLETGAGVLAALKELGYDAVGIDWTSRNSLPRKLEDAGIEVVWNALHGTYGEDGAVQGLCACMHILCTGSGIQASAVAMDKISSKRIFESHGVATPTWQLWPQGTPRAELRIHTPLVVKPANEGSSVGVSIVKNMAQFDAAVALAESCHGPTLIEEYIAGTEIFVGVLDDRSLGTIEVRPATEFYDYEAKYKRNDTQYLLPAQIAEDVARRAEQMGLEAHRALGCHSYSRVDLRIREDGAPFILEVNTLPGMTSHSLMPKLAARAGISYAQLCERILLEAR